MKKGYFRFGIKWQCHKVGEWRGEGTRLAVIRFFHGMASEEWQCFTCYANWEPDNLVGRGLTMAEAISDASEYAIRQMGMKQPTIIKAAAGGEGK